MNKYLTIAATLALGLGAASAQSTTVTPVQVTNFTDIPAGHWAKDAVELITSKGLIQGFPDGTFRGNENLTRYQAALIFARLLQNGGLSSGNLSADQVALITKGMQDVSTELAAVSSRVSDLEKASADQQARITALEGKIDSAANAGSADLSARVDALEAAVKAAAPADNSAQVTDLTNRIAALEARGTTTTTTVVTPSEPSTVVIGDGTTTVAGTGFYAGIDTGFNFGHKKGRFGSGSNNSSSDSSELPFISSFGATIGASNLIYGLGLRADVDYTPWSGGVNADINAIYNIMSSNGLTPYVGLGFGGMWSQDRFVPNEADTAENGRKSIVTDAYLKGILGVDYKINNNFGIFGEFDGKYYFSAKGSGVNLDDTDAYNAYLSNRQNSADTTGTGYTAGTAKAKDTKGFIPAVKLGVKYFF